MYAYFGNNKHTQLNSNLCIVYFYIPSTLIVCKWGHMGGAHMLDATEEMGRFTRRNAHFLTLSKLRHASYFRMFDDVAMGFAFEGIPEPNLNLIYDLLSAGKSQVPRVCIQIYRGPQFWILMCTSTSGVDLKTLQHLGASVNDSTSQSTLKLLQKKR